MSISVVTAGNKCYLLIFIVSSLLIDYVLPRNTTVSVTPPQPGHHNQHVANIYGWAKNHHNSPAPHYGWVNRKTTTTRRPQHTRPPPTNHRPTARPPTRPLTHPPKPPRRNDTHVRPPKTYPPVHHTPPTMRPPHPPTIRHTPPTRPTYGPPSPTRPLTHPPTHVRPPQTYPPVHNTPPTMRPPHPPTIKHTPPTRPTYRPPSPTQRTPTRHPRTTKRPPSTRPPVITVDPNEHFKWQINYTIQKIDHKYDYASEYLNNDRMGTFLLEKLNTLNPASYLEATKLPHRPYYDHYRVYYNGSRFSTNNLQTEIPVNQIDVCKGGSQILCPNGTHALCMNGGKILCLGSKTNTLPCNRFPENPPPHLDMLDIISPMVFDRSPFHTCVDTWRIPCYKFTKKIDQCNYKDPSHETLLRLRCLFNTTVIGNFEIVNNTIIPTNKNQNNLVITTTPSSLWNKPVAQSFCVVVLAEPRLTEFHKGNNLLLPGAENLLAKFAIKALDPYNVVPVFN